MTIPEYQLREFRYPDDFAAVIELWSQAGSGVHLGRSDQPEEIQKKLHHDPDLFIVAEVNSRIVGAVVGGYDGRRGLAYHLAVDPNLRQQGIGQALMEELEQRMRNKGCLKCYLLVVPDNRQAIDFYQKRGWERMDLYVFGKELL